MQTVVISESVHQLKMENHIDGPKTEHVRAASSDFPDDTRPENANAKGNKEIFSVKMSIILDQGCTETSRPGSETAQLSLSLLVTLIPLEMPQCLQVPSYLPSSSKLLC